MSFAGSCPLLIYWSFYCIQINAISCFHISWNICKGNCPKWQKQVFSCVSIAAVFPLHTYSSIWGHTHTSTSCKTALHKCWIDLFLDFLSNLWTSVCDSIWAGREGGRRGRRRGRACEGRAVFSCDGSCLASFCVCHWKVSLHIID